MTRYDEQFPEDAERNASDLQECIDEIHRLQDENERLRELAMAVHSSEFDGFSFDLINGVAWWDARDELCKEESK